VSLQLSPLARLRSAAAALQTEAEAARLQLQRLDAAIERLDAATALRDRVLEEHDRAVADAIVHRRGGPAINPALNLAEIDLRKASGEARATLMVRPRCAEVLRVLDSMSDLELAAHMFPEAERGARPTHHDCRGAGLLHGRIRTGDAFRSMGVLPPKVRRSAEALVSSGARRATPRRCAA
jgi:hypothetical protein